MGKQDALAIYRANRLNDFPIIVSTLCMNIEIHSPVRPL